MNEEILPEIDYEVNICGQTTQISAESELEAATKTIELLRELRQNFHIGTIIQVTNVETKVVQYLVSEIVLANAGLYNQARELQEASKKKTK